MNDGYGQTDVMHDPNYLRSLLTHNNPRIRAQGEEGLRQLQAQEVHQQQLAEFQQREADRNLAHDENLGLRQSEADNRGVQREAMASDQAAKGEDRRSAMLHAILSDPQAAPEVKQAIQGHLMKQAGITATLPVDPKVAALARSKGLPAPTPTTIGGNTPTAQGTAPTGGSVDTGISAPFGVPPVQRNVDAGHVVGPMASQIPAGKDLNFNTGELVDHNMEGTINGQPARTAVAEGAIRTGHSPEDTRSREVYNSMRSNPSLAINQPQINDKNMVANPAVGPNPPTGENMVANPVTTPTNPAPNESMVANPTAPRAPTPWSPAQLAAGSRPLTDNLPESSGPANTSSTPAASWHPSQLAGEPAATPLPAPASPHPNVTPAPGTQFQGPLTAAGNFLSQPNAPVPQPAQTPPALPPVKRPTPDEERQRMMANQ